VWSDMARLEWVVVSSVVIGIAFPYHLPSEDAHRTVRMLDDLGARSLWVYENPRDLGAFAIAGACQALTRHVTVSVGTVNWYTRTPETIAMESLAAAHVGSRPVRVGLSAGSQREAADLEVDYRPLAAIAEYIERIRNFELVPSVAYESMQEGPELYIGAIGPKMLSLCARAADGLLISMHAPPGFISEARSQLERDALAVGRRTPRVAAYVHVVTAHDLAAAKSKAKTEVARTLRRVGDSPALRRLFGAVEGDLVEAYVHAVDRLRSSESPTAAVPDDLLDALVVWGDEDEAIRKLDQYSSAGADELILVSPSMTPSEYRGLLSTAL